MSKTKRPHNSKLQVVQISTIPVAQGPQNISSFLPATAVSLEDSARSVKNTKYIWQLEYRLVVQCLQCPCDLKPNCCPTTTTVVVQRLPGRRRTATSRSSGPLKADSACLLLILPKQNKIKWKTLLAIFSCRSSQVRRVSYLLENNVWNKAPIHFPFSTIGYFSELGLVHRKRGY